MRILFLSQRVPYPPHRGDKIPSYHYIRGLSRRHDVAVACLADGADDAANADGLRDFVHSIDVVTLSKRRAQLRALSALAGRRPLTLAYFDEPELRRRVHDRIASGQVDAVLVFSSGMAQFVEAYSDLPRVIQFADLDSQKWQQFAQATLPPRSWVYQSECHRLLQYERHIAASFDRSLVCAPRECDDFRRLIPGADIECLPNGVDLDYFQPQPKIVRQPLSMIFTGVMNYRPNVDGMIWFCTEVLPRIQAKHPGATLTICGAEPDRSVRALERHLGVQVTGAVADVRPWIAKSSVAVVPLRLARGIQNKLLEAMAMGVPAVATPAAAAGIDATAERDLLVAADSDEFTAAVLRLFDSPDLRDQIGRHGRKSVEGNYHWDVTLNRLDDIMTQAAEPRLTPAIA